jgi:hypothetical protein
MYPRASRQPAGSPAVVNTCGEADKYPSPVPPPPLTPRRPPLKALLREGGGCFFKKKSGGVPERGKKGGIRRGPEPITLKKARQRGSPSERRSSVEVGRFRTDSSYEV